jgi:uncharacterized protein
MDKRVCVSLLCVQSALYVSSSADEQGRGVWYGGSRQRWNRWWQRFFGEKLAMEPPEIRIKRWCRSRGPGEGHLGKIGLHSTHFGTTAYMNDLHTPRSAWKPVATFGLALGVFVAASLAARALPESVTSRYPWARQAVSQGLMAAVALGAMAVSTRPFAEFGFRRPAPAKGHFKLWGLVLGTASTGIILAFGLRGMQAHLAAYGLLGIVLWIWVISSIVEEIFCRGWFQTLAGEGTRAAIIWSTALFGSMHLVLLFGDIEIAAVVVIVLSVTALGYICATARARTSSLRPAIVAHVMFNVGAFLAGVIYAIAYRVATGHMPST